MMTNEYLYTITQFVIEMYKWPTVCEYDKDQYVRYIYYILSHFNYIIMCNVLNHHMSWFTKAISISISIPVIYNRLIKETYKLYNTIENIILNRVAYIGCYWLNRLSFVLYQSDPKINEIELRFFISRSEPGLLQKCASSCVICVLCIYFQLNQYTVLSTIVKKYYKTERTTKVENLFLHRNFEQLADPFVLLKMYSIYEKQCVSKIPLHKQLKRWVSNATNFIQKTYYSYYINELFGIPYISPIFSILFNGFDHRIVAISLITCGTLPVLYDTTVVQLIHSTKVDLGMVSNVVYETTTKYIDKHGLWYIDPCVMYMMYSIAFSYMVSSNVVYFVILLNVMYQLMYRHVYEISIDKHSVIFMCNVVIGGLSGYNAFHMMYVTLATNAYLYFLWMNGRYKKPQKTMKIEHYF
jgi:hypothetical protein